MVVYKIETVYFKITGGILLVQRVAKNNYFLFGPAVLTKHSSRMQLGSCQEDFQAYCQRNKKNIDVLQT